MLSFTKKSKLSLRREIVATLSTTSLDGVLGGAAGAMQGPALEIPPVQKNAQARVYHSNIADMIGPRRIGSCFCPPGSLP